MPTPIEQWFYDMPVVTKCYLLCTALVTLAVNLDFISWLSLYFDYKLILYRSEYWRILTSFFYFGNLDLNWMFNTYFLVRYMCDVEEGRYSGRTADFLWLLIVAGFCLMNVSLFTTILFLGKPLNSAITYIWSRQNPDVLMSFFGFFTFSAPYLPWVMLASSWLVLNKVPIDEITGIILGHILWFLSDEWPRRPESYGINILKAPFFIERLFRSPELHPDIDISGNFANDPANQQLAQNIPRVNAANINNTNNKSQSNIQELNSQSTLRKRNVGESSTDQTNTAEKPLASTSSSSAATSSTYQHSRPGPLLNEKSAQEQTNDVTSQTLPEKSE